MARQLADHGLVSPPVSGQSAQHIADGGNCRNRTRHSLCNWTPVRNGWSQARQQLVPADVGGRGCGERGAAEDGEAAEPLRVRVSHEERSTNALRVTAGAGGMIPLG